MSEDIAMKRTAAPIPTLSANTTQRPIELIAVLRLFSKEGA
jgi:hypothetical protein